MSLFDMYPKPYQWFTRIADLVQIIWNMSKMVSMVYRWYIDFIEFVVHPETYLFQFKLPNPVDAPADGLLVARRCPHFTSHLITFTYPLITVTHDKQTELEWIPVAVGWDCSVWLFLAWQPGLPQPTTSAEEANVFTRYDSVCNTTKSGERLHSEM